MNSLSRYITLYLILATGLFFSSPGILNHKLHLFHPWRGLVVVIILLFTVKLKK